MSKETFYFTHDYNARNDIKIQALLVEHGAIGYGVYWIIIEILHEESTKKLKLDNLTDVAIARQACTSIEQVKAIIKCCLEYELFIEDNGYYYSKRVLKNMNKRLEISEKRAKAGRKSAKKRQKASNEEDFSTCVDENPTSVEENATSVDENSTSVGENATKERKGKESKRKKSKRNSIVDTNVSMSDATHPTQEKVDFKELINFFNDETHGIFGKVIYPISDKRKGIIRARIKDFGKDAFAEMIRKACKSDFLKGGGNKGFVANFDWMIRPSNFQKILEGNYDNKNKKHISDETAIDEELMHHIRQGIARGIEENAV